MNTGKVVPLSTLAVLLLVLGCESKALPAAPSPGWSKIDLVGWRYLHSTEKESISLRFQANGEVYTTITKNVKASPPGEAPDAPIAPLFYWSIDEGGRLLICYLPDDAAMWTWELISLSPTSAQVLWDSTTYTFQRERND